MPDCGVRGPRFESHRRQLFIVTATAIYSLGHGLHTLTEVPRSTYTSTLRGTVKWVTAFGLSNNKMAMVHVDGSCHCFLVDSQSKSVGLVCGLAATSALSLHSSNEWGELLQWLCHDDSTINIISGYYYYYYIIIWWYLVSRACDWVMPALSAVLPTFQFPIQFAFLQYISLIRPHQSHIYGSGPHQHCSVLLDNIGQWTLPKIWDQSINQVMIKAT